MSDNHLLQDTSEDTARLSRITADTINNSVYITRMWPDIDASVADTLLAALQAITSVTNPKVDGHAYGGVYKVSTVYMEGKNDRSVDIFQILVPDAPYSYTATVAIDYLKDETYKIFSDLTETQLSAELAKYTRALYDANATSNGRGNSYRFDFNRNNDTKLWNLRIVKTTVYEREVAAYTAESSYNETVTKQEIRNYDGDDPPSAAAATTTATTVTAHAVEARLTDEGRFDVVKTDTVKTLNKTALTYESDEDTLSTASNTITLNVPVADANLNITAPTTGQAKSKSVRGYDPKTNTVDIEDRTESSEKRTTGPWVSDIRVDGTTETTITRNEDLTAGEDIPDSTRVETANTVTVTRYSGERNKFKDKVDVTKEVVTRNLQSKTITGEIFKDASRATTEELTFNKKAGTGVVSLTATAGHTKRATIGNYNPEFNTVDITETDEVTSTQSINATLLDTTAVKETLIGAKAASSAIALSTDPAGTVTRLEVSKLDNDTFDYRQVTRVENYVPGALTFTPLDVPGQTVTDTISHGVKSGASELTAAATPGYAVELEVSYDKIAKVADVRKRVRQADNLTTYETVDTHDGLVVKTKQTAVATKATNPVSGTSITNDYKRTGSSVDNDLINTCTIKKVTQQISQFKGKCVEEIEELYPKKVDTSDHYLYTKGYTQANGSQVKIKIIRNATDEELQEDLTVASNAIKADDNNTDYNFGVPRRNVFGLWDYTLVVTTPLAAIGELVTSDYEWQQKQRQYKTEKNAVGVKERWYRDVVLTFNTRILYGLKNALKFIGKVVTDDGGHGLGYRPGSGISAIGNGMYKCDRLESITIPVTDPPVAGGWTKET